MNAQTPPPPPREELAPPDYFDPVIEVYKKDVDRSLLRENLKLTVAERLCEVRAVLEIRKRTSGGRAKSTRGEVSAWDRILENYCRSWSTTRCGSF